MIPHLSVSSKEIFLHIAKHQPISKKEICEALGKLTTSINRMMEPLAQAGLIREIGIGDSSGGRKPLLYGVTEDRYYLVAINISTLYYEVAIVRLDMSIVSIRRQDMNAGDLPSLVLEQILGVLTRMLCENGIERNRLIGCGVSVFNSINPKTKRIPRSILVYTHEEWFNCPITEILQRELAIPIFIEKATNAAALLEYNFGQAKGCRRMLYIQCAMNIRAAVISKGEFLNIDPFYEDALGHMVVKYDGEMCPCGQRGCANNYATIPAIVKTYRMAVHEPSDERNRISVRQMFPNICELAKRNDETAQAVLLEAAGIFGVALANYYNLFCPDVVVLSGLLRQESSIYYDAATKKAFEGVLFSNRRPKILQPGSFSNAITVGAAAVALEGLFS